jgi:hypothetical protein
VTLVSPLATWLPGARAEARFRRRWLGRAPVVLPARDRAWRAIGPGFAGAVALAGSGVPFQIVADRRYDRAADRARLPHALAAGATVFLPQVHQVLPRLARLMVALRATVLGPFREESSFLFVVEGRGREGMGLHHDGDVDAFWLQLQGRRTVTVGPPVPRGTPEDLDGPGRGPGWWTGDLAPGTLFYLPPRTPHRVVCRGRSVAVSLTWKARARRAPRDGRADARARAAGLTVWDVASGRAVMDRARPGGRLWTQVPVVAGPVAAGGRFACWTPEAELSLPAAARPLARRLAAMPSVQVDGRRPARGVALLRAQGILAEEDLPRRIVPVDPAALDGWRFA